MVSEVLGTEAFTIIQSIALNPGIAASFPWLSIQAQGWEQYRFTKLVFWYLYFTGSQTAGQVRLIPDYDALDPPPSSALASSSYQDVKVGAANANLDAALNPSSMFPMGPRKFIRNGPIANSDLKTYDAGNMFVSTNYAVADATPFGEIWVEYECEFFVPQIPVGGSSFIHSTSAAPTSSDILPSPTVVSGSLPVSVAGNVITFPAAGAYFVSLNQTASTSVTVSAPTTTGTFDASFNGFGYTISGSTTTDATLNVLVLVSAPSQTLSVNNVLVGGNGAILTISLLPPGSI
jgi:hypothetical protein